MNAGGIDWLDRYLAVLGRKARIEGKPPLSLRREGLIRESFAGCSEAEIARLTRTLEAQVGGPE